MNTLYAVLVTGKEVCVSDSNEIITNDGDKFIVCNDTWGPSGFKYYETENLPFKIKTWKTAASAWKFAKKWGGHPWWVKPKDFEIIELEPNMVTVQRGWKLVSPPEVSDE